MVEPVREKRNIAGLPSASLPFGDGDYGNLCGSGHGSVLVAGGWDGVLVGFAWALDTECLVQLSWGIAQVCWSDSFSFPCTRPLRPCFLAGALVLECGASWTTALLSPP